MGIMTIKISLGKLLFDMDLVIYQGDHAECLIGLDILNDRFNLLISPDGAYIKSEDLARHNKIQKVSKIGTYKNQQIVVSVRDQVSINPRQQKLIWVCIQQKDVEGLSLDNLISDPWVCHSEDIDHLIMDEKKMTVWYTLIELQKNDLSFEILFNNCSDQNIDFWPGDEIAHLEKMTPVSEASIQLQTNEFTQMIYKLLNVPGVADTMPSLKGAFEEGSLSTIDERDFDQLNVGLPEFREHLVSWCKTNKQLFAAHKFDVGQTTSSDAVDFTLVQDATVCVCRPIATNQKLIERGLEFISKMLDKGLISYADKYTGWCLPAFFLLKAQPYQALETTGDAMVKEQINENKLPVRLILDLRALNKRILRKSAASWPQESCRNILNRLRGSKFLTSLDFNQAYWQMRLSEKCRRYTGHNLINLHFILNRAPLGLAISGSCWAAMLQKRLIENGLSTHVLAFVDDCMLATKGATEHKEYLIRLLTTFKKAGWKLKQKKCFFYLNNTDVLIYGWSLSLKNDTIQADPEKLKFLLKMERPKTTRQTRKFVGLLNVYHDAFEKVAKYLGPLFELCSPSKKFCWTEQCDFAFKQALKMIATAKLLHLPDFFEPFVAVTDAAKGQFASWAV